MFYQIKKKIDLNLSCFVAQIDKTYALTKISPLLSQKIRNFILRPGKRIRPILFVIGYKGYNSKNAFGLYRSALSVELLHDFMLIHDDIIDKAYSRRNKPSMHVMFDSYLAKKGKSKFNGVDLAIVAGDIVYALAIDAFLAVKTEPLRKEKALKNFVKAAALTGSGEFIELIKSLDTLDSLKKSDIYRIYDYKTAFYTFSCPLATGAILAGTQDSELKKLNNYGKYLGRAFQIRDDILGLFGDEKKTGKPALSDLQEAKKTLLIFYTYKECLTGDQKKIKKIFGKEKVSSSDLAVVQKLCQKTKALDSAQKDINKFLQKSQLVLESLAMEKKYKKALNDYFLPLFSEQI